MNAINMIIFFKYKREKGGKHMRKTDKDKLVSPKESH